MNNTEIKTVELIVNSEQARKRLDELSTKLEQLKVKRDNALNKGDSRGLAVYTREIKKLENEIGRTATRAETMSRALSNLDKSTPNELKRIRENFVRSHWKSHNTDSDAPYRNAVLFLSFPNTARNITFAAVPRLSLRGARMQRSCTHL